MNLSQFKTVLNAFRCRVAKPGWWRVYKEAVSHDDWSSEQVAAFNFQLRQELVALAYAKCPFYREKFRQIGFEPGDLKSEDDWVRLPILTRDDLRSRFDDIKVQGLKKRSYRTVYTGGSTGNPTCVLKDLSFDGKMLDWRACGWAGIPLGQNTATVMRAHPRNWKQEIRSFLAWWPSRNLMIDASRMTDETIGVFVKEWLRVKPVHVNGYVGGLQQIALFCLEHHIELPPPKGLFTTASPVTAVERAALTDAFHAPVFDSYMGTEAHPMAGQCACQGADGSRALHIHSDYRHLEFVDAQGKILPTGTTGDILVTDCTDRVFPIIRYRMGDRGRALPGRCRCGLPYALMDAVEGRSGYKIYLEDGVLTGGLTVIFDGCPDAVRGFRIHQFADKSVTLTVVPNWQYANARREIAQAVEGLRQKLGGLPLKVEEVEELSHDRGKLTFISSDVKG